MNFWDNETISILLTLCGIHIYLILILYTMKNVYPSVCYLVL